MELREKIKTVRKEIEDTKREIMQLQEKTAPIVAEADKTEESNTQIPRRNQSIEEKSVLHQA